MSTGADMGELTSLGLYILDLIESQNLSMREASLKAGLAPETISQMLRRGKASTPRPDTLRLLADGLNGNYEYMMQLAGHLPPRSRGNTIPAEQQARIEHIIDVWREIAELDPASLGRLLAVVEGQAEMAQALMEAGQRLQREDSRRAAE